MWKPTFWASAAMNCRGIAGRRHRRHRDRTSNHPSGVHRQQCAPPGTTFGNVNAMFWPARLLRRDDFVDIILNNNWPE
jgi:hypothetical protein